MEWRQMEKTEAENIANQWSSVSYEEFIDMMDNWGLGRNGSPQYVDLRMDLVYLDESSGMSKNTNKNSYPSDLDFAIGLYELLTNKYGMNAADASDDRIWRYMQMEIVPDVVYYRWPGSGSSRLNANRMWDDTRRIWFKALWWYIHLSYQGSLEETKKILSGNSSDDISQLLDRAGSGYRISLYRAIMRRYNETDRSNKLLRKVLKMNVVLCGTMEPLLHEGGVDQYVDELFKYFGA